MNNQLKVTILADALNYVKRYAGRTIVIKYGGNAMIDKELEKRFANDLALLTLVGVRPVIVHGGGPHINANLAALKIESHFINGLRYTDSATMKVVEQVLGGEVNQQVVRNINRHGARAVGLTGKDDGFIVARKFQPQDDNGNLIDIGQVGEITHIKKEVIELLQQAGIIPVIAPVAYDENGDALNINADTAAAEIAIALSAEALFLLTNTPGILDDNNTLITHLKTSQVNEMIDQRVIKGGMKPKIDCAIHAVQNGVKSCQIIDGRLPHALLLELFTDEGAGTFIEDDTP